MYDLGTKLKRTIRFSVVVVILALVITVICLLMLKYAVEGENNMPFELSQLIVVSTAEGVENNKNENIWNFDLIQNNDIYIYFKKNEKLDSEVQKIRIDNLQIKRNKEIGSTKLFLPTSNDIKTNFKNSTEDYSKKGIEYTVNAVDNMEKQEIGQTGGILAFRISNQELANYVSNEEAELQYNGTLLQKAGITEQDIKITASMDITIEISKKEKYKGTLTLELPIEDFNEKSILGTEKTDLSDVIFKRSE